MCVYVCVCGGGEVLWGRNFDSQLGHIIFAENDLKILSTVILPSLLIKKDSCQLPAKICT